LLQEEALPYRARCQHLEINIIFNLS
jgi:hypothetical protein